MAENGTIARVVQLPDCTFCKLLTDNAKVNGSPVFAVRKAKYDFRTTNGQWAFGCQLHFEMHRLHSELGLGKGQMLLTVSGIGESDPAGQT
jgi:hypothetical protein